jgi:hypothetical protein
MFDIEGKSFGKVSLWLEFESLQEQVFFFISHISQTSCGLCRAASLAEGCTVCTGE